MMFIFLLNYWWFMAIPSFYCDELTVDVLQSNESTITLSESESGHAVRARRLREGQPVNVLNGLGLVGIGKITVIDKRAVQISFDSHDFKPKAEQELTIATAIPKGDRQKVMVDMLTQLGVTQIIPLQCEHSVTRYSDNLGQKWQRAAIESCKQSQNPWLPIIGKAHNVEQLLTNDNHHIVYADAGGESMMGVCERLKLSGSSRLMVIIGPEGGLSVDEINVLNLGDVSKLSLANNILRTEAAAIAVAAQFVQSYN